MIYRFGEHQLDDQRLTLSDRDGVVHLEPQVFRLLHHLVVHRDRVVSKEELLDEIWGDRFVSESALTSRVKTARQAVGDDGASQQVIKTVHGRGYHFVAEVSTELENRRRGLPRLRVELIDRDDDVAGVVDRLGSAALVTITGSGGIGKTTAAIAAAERMQREFADGAVFVDLSPVLPGDDITRAVAEAVGLEGDAARTAQTVAEHLAHRPVLVLLDNCEHVLDAAAGLVEQILDLRGSAVVLATSREPLGVRGEHVWPLSPLKVGGPDLFVARATAAEPRVDWDPHDPAVVDLCDRLDNVPLALELAAGQLRRFGLDELVEHLDSHLVLLTRGRSDRHRHAAIETTIVWSYQLLDPVEQQVLRHLSVFPASFDLDAASVAVPSLPAPETAALVGGLVDKSLVVRAPDTGRYRLLEMIRVFGRRRLDDAGETAAALEAHRAHVRDRVGSTSRLERWMSAQLAVEFRAALDDVRLAFGESLVAGHVDDAVEIAVGGSFLWRNAMGWLEGSGWVEQLRRCELSPRDRLWVEILRADVGQGRGDHRQLFDAAQEAREQADELAQDDPAAACLATHFASLRHLTDPETAEGALVESLELARVAGDPRLVALMESFVAVTHIIELRYDQARTLVDRLGRECSDDGYDAYIVHWTGWMLGLAARDAEETWRWMNLQQDLLDRTGIVETWLTWFSGAFCEAVDGRDVRERLGGALALADREGYDATGDCVLALAYSEMCAGRLEAAAEMIGTALHSRFNATAHHVLYRAVLDAPLRQDLDADTLRAAMARGRDRTAAEVLAERGVTV